MRGAAGGDVAGDERGGDQQQDDAGEGRGVGGPGAEEQGLDPRCGGKRADAAERDSDDRQPERAADHAALYLRRGGAERHADADLLRLARYPIGDDAVDSQRGENQAERREAADQQDEEAAGRYGVVHDLLEGAKLGGGLGGVE